MPAQLPAGFEELYRSQLLPLVRFLYKRGASWPDACDAAQESFVEALRRWDRIDKPAAWVRITAWRWYVKQQKRDARDVLEAERAWWGSNTCIAEADFELSERAKWVYEAIRELPPRQREVIACHYDGFETGEIAEILGISHGAVRSNLSYARANLKKILQNAPRRREDPE